MPRGLYKEVANLLSIIYNCIQSALFVIEYLFQIRQLYYILPKSSLFKTKLLKLTEVQFRLVKLKF